METHLIEDGAYPNMSESDYRSHPAISQSLLKEFGKAATPLHFKTAQGAGPKEASADMEFGTVCHAAVLTPKLFAESYHLRPDDYPTEEKGFKIVKPWHGAAAFCKKWLAEHADRPVMTKEQIVKVGKIRERLLKLPEFASALATGQTEVACFKRDEETGLMLKARVDLMAVDAKETMWCFDLKKVQCGCATEKEFSKSCADYGYDIQAASYLEITGATKFVFVPFDDDEPFDAIQYDPDSEMFAAGYRKWRSLLLRYAECLKSGEFPGYAGGINRLSLPEWARK